MYPYPSSFPTEEVGVLLPILRGKVPPTDQAVQAGWVVVGYGASKLQPAQVTISAATTVTAESLADQLEAAGVLNHASMALPWETLLPILTNLLLTWLTKPR